MGRAFDTQMSRDDILRMKILLRGRFPRQAKVISRRNHTRKKMKGAKFAIDEEFISREHAEVVMKLLAMASKVRSVGTHAEFEF